MNKRKHIYKKENCTCCVRIQQTKDVFGFTMTLLGQHGFDWEVVIREQSKTRTIRFKERSLAVKEFNKRRGK